jgi:hypothetical protein
MHKLPRGKQPLKQTNTDKSRLRKKTSGKQQLGDMKNKIQEKENAL